LLSSRRLWKGNALKDWTKRFQSRRLSGRWRAAARIAGLFLLGVLLSYALEASARHPGTRSAGVVHAVDLPPEAQETLALIGRGGPFPYSRDGAVFANREGRLPLAPRNAYREYTVRTPHSRDRGARRIIAGNNKFWYTADHYRSFRRIVE
jgi:ribonuclease T1